MRLCIVGTGYVGLVGGACFAETGNDVVCVDVNADKIARLNAGEVPIFEPGLEEVIERNVKAGRLTFSTDVEGSIGRSEIVFVAVGTPPRPDGGADLSAVDKVAETVAKAAQNELILVLKSTVPVGTNARVRGIVEGAEQRIHVVSNPEFLREGAALGDFLRPDRIVIGCESGDEFTRSRMARLYHPVCLAKDRIVWMDPASAELTKYVANTMLAMRISFMNEVAMLCERVGGDVHSVRHGVGSDSRIGSKFLYAGPGYGGSCFPKDVQALAHTARDHGVQLELVEATHRVNNAHKGVLARKAKALFGGNLRGRRIAVWGIAFKPRTDDIRDSPALTLIDTLLAEGAEVVAHDPEAMENARGIYGEKVRFAEGAYEAADGSDCVILVTEWREYQNPDFDRLMKTMKTPNLVDGRNIWTIYGLSEQGFHYEGIGAREA